MNEIKYMDSREIAKIIGKEHSHLCRDISGYIRAISTNPSLDWLDKQNKVVSTTSNLNRLNPSQFFIPYKYTDKKGQERTCYLCTRKGCEMIANKMTGVKGIQFTAVYINRFHEMEQPTLPTIKAYTPADAIYLMGDISKALQATLAIREGIALAKGLEMAQEATGVNLEPVRELLPPAQHETGYLNPTQIGKRVSLSARKVNDKLREMGLQRKDSSGWRLEDAGREYGEEMPYSKNGHAGYQIRWNSRVIEVLGEVQ